MEGFCWVCGVLSEFESNKKISRYFVTKNKSMQRITLTVKDDNKMNFLLELLKQFEFIEVQKSEKKKKGKYDFFASAGLLKRRDIDSKKLRKDAWTRSR